MKEEGYTIWFTGLSGSGKSTLARMLHTELAGWGHQSEVLDSGRIRQLLNRSLGFTRDEIEANLLRLAYECKLLNRNGVIALVAAVSPYRDVRDRVRQDIGRFIEVYCRCPLETLIDRDQADLYKRAQRGEIDHVAGVNSPYEEPLHPEALLDTDREPPAACLQKITAALKSLHYLPEQEASAYTADEEAIIRQRLQDLGYI